MNSWLRCGFFIGLVVIRVMEQSHNGDGPSTLARWLCIIPAASGALIKLKLRNVKTLGSQYVRIDAERDRSSVQSGDRGGDEGPSNNWRNISGKPGMSSRQRLIRCYLVLLGAQASFRQRRGQATRRVQ